MLFIPRDEICIILIMTQIEQKTEQDNSGIFLSAAHSLSSVANFDEMTRCCEWNFCLDFANFREMLKQRDFNMYFK